VEQKEKKSSAKNGWNVKYTWLIHRRWHGLAVGVWPSCPAEMYLQQE